MPSPFYPSSVVLFQFHGGHGQSYASISHTLLNCTYSGTSEERTIWDQALGSLFRGCLLSEVDHFYHATAPYYSVIILLFAVARFLADYSLVFIHVAYLIFIESVFQ